MSVFGNYTLGEDLTARLPYGRTVAAVREGDGGAYVLKIRSPNPMARASEATVELEALRVSAQIQAGMKAGSGWAEIVDRGDVGDETYVATRRYPNTAGALVTGRARIDERALVQLLRGCVLAISSLESSAGRGHGHLSAENVLIDDSKGVGSWDVVLTDPVDEIHPDDKLDRLALGEVAYSLVTHQEFDSLRDYPLRPAGAWARFGTNATAWTDLLNLLLTPDDPTGGVPWAELDSRLAAIKPFVEKRSKMPLILGAVALLAVAGGAGWFFLGGGGGPAEPEVVPVEANSPEFELAKADAARWVPRFVGRDFSQRDKGAMPEAISDVIAKAERLDRWEEDTAGLNPQDAGRLVARWRELKSSIDALLVSAESGSERLESAGVPGVAARMEQLRAGAGDAESGYSFQGMVALAAEVDDLGEAAAHLDAIGGHVERIDSAWNQTRTEQVVGDRDDPVLGRIERIVQHRLGLVELSVGWHERLAELVREVESVAAFTASSAWAELDAVELISVTDRQFGQRDVADLDFSAWLRLAMSDEVKLLPSDTDPRSTELGSLRSKLTTVRGRWATVEGESDAETLADVVTTEDRALIDAVVDPAMSAALDEIEGLRWARSNVNRVQSVLESTRTAVLAAEGSVTAIERQLSADIADFIAGLEGQDSPSGVDSASISSAWVTWRDALIAEYQAEENASDRRFRSRISDAEVLLAQIVQRLTIAGGDPALSEALRARRESALASFVASSLDGVDVRSVVSDSDDAVREQILAQADEAAAVELAWFEQIESGLRTLADVQRGLSGFADLDGVVDGGGQTLREAADVLRSTPAFGNPGLDEQRRVALVGVDDLVAIADEQDPEQLRAIVVDTSRRPQTSLAALRMLRDAPGSPGDLAATVAGARSLSNSVGDEAAGIRSEIAELVRVRWVSAADAAGSLDQFERVLAVAGDAGIDLSAQSEAIQWNAAQVELAALSRSTAEDESAQASAAAWLDAHRGRAGVMGVDPAWLDRLEEIASGAEDEGPRFVPAEAGPGAVGWTVQEGPGDTLTYSMAGLSLRFARVDVAGGTSAYVATQELSVDEFSAIAASSGVSPVVSDWIGSNAATSTTWSGPRSWEVEAGRVKENSYWLKSNSNFAAGRSAYAAPFADAGDMRAINAAQGVPSGDHPMQEIPANVAYALATSIGCRFPTEAEWGTAQAREPGNTWNLRDATWLTQQQYVQSIIDQRVQFDWADNGQFVPAAVEVAEESDAAVGNVPNDGVLWFRTVSNGGAGVFQNIIGNVAEYVQTEVPPDPATEPGFRVIGGSALSSPELNPTTAYEVPRGRRGYQSFADVGVRLAFSAEGAAKPSTTELLAEHLAQLPFSPSGS